MRKKQLVHQHGDVILTPVSKLPSGAKELERVTFLVIERGEKTGHAHAIESSEGVASIIDSATGDKYIQVFGKKGTLVHEDHKQQTIAPGIYKQGRVREQDLISREMRSVVD